MTHAERARTKRLGAAVALAAASALGAIAALGVGPAGATTGDSIGLPPPEVRIPLKYGHPLAGRNFLYEAVPQAHMISALLDIEGETEGITGERVEEWMYGELELRQYEDGRPVVDTFALYPFTFSEKTHLVTAGLVPRDSVSPEHELGINEGHITFVVPHPQDEFIVEAEEPKFQKAFIALDGHGPYEVIFKRGNDDTVPPQVLPRAKTLTKKAKAVANKKMKSAKTKQANGRKRQASGGKRS